MTDATLDAMKARGTCLIPTVALGEAILATPMMQKASAEFRKRSIDLFAAAHDTALRAWKKGVVFATGTDTNDLLLPAFTAASEVAEFVKIGIPPAQALKAATSDAANCIGVSSRTGSIKAGLEADLLLIQGDPRADVENLKHIELVMNDGRIVIDNRRKRDLSSPIR